MRPIDRSSLRFSPPRLPEVNLSGALLLGLTLLTLTVGALERLLAPALPVVLLAVFPVAFAGWRLGRPLGLALAALASVAAVLAAAAGLGAHWRGVDLLAGLTLGLRALSFAGVALAAAHARDVVEALAERSERDPLTGLYNRLGFLRRAERERRRATRVPTTLSVAFLDVDDFKALNDVYGHHAGDRVLELLGEVLSSGRSGDVAARMGGDEFVLLMPDTGRVEAKAAVERLRHLAAQRLHAEGLPVTFTAGVASVTTPPANVEALLQEADRLMYAGKRARKTAGRGRVPVMTPTTARLALAAAPAR